MAENFKLNRARQDFARQKSHQRTGMPRVLIVTEGAVTEVEYFTDLCRSLGLSPITVMHPAEGICVEGEKCGSAPISIFRFAHKEFLRKDPKIKGIAQKYYWDEVYCVFDRDSHLTYSEAIEKIEALQKHNQGRIFRAITSHRCFEIWFLLHFKDTSKDFPNAEAIVKELKKIQHEGKYVFAGYEHGSKGIFARIKDRLQKAKAHANKLNSNAIDSQKSPHTYVGDLVTRIEKIADIRRSLGLATKN